MDAASAGLAVFVAIVLVALAGVHAVSRRLHPWRVRLFEAAQDLIDDPRTSAADRATYDRLLDHSQSFGAGWIVPRAMARTLVRLIRGEAQAADGLTAQDRVYGLFALSVLFANPIALALCVPLTAALVVVSVARHARLRATFEADTRDVASLSLGLAHA